MVAESIGGMFDSPPTTVMVYAADLLVFQKAIALLEEVLRLTSARSDAESAVIGGDMRSSVVRVAGCIAEACLDLKLSRVDLCHARAALARFESCLDIAETTGAFEPVATLRMRDLVKNVRELLERLIVATPHDNDPEWRREFEDEDDFDDPMAFAE